MSKKKRILYFFLVGIFLFCGFFLPNNVAYADSSTEETLSDLTSLINEQLENLDLSNFEELLNNLSEEQKQIFGSSDFFSKLKSLLSGEQQLDFAGILSCIFSLISGNILNVIPVLSLICAVAILSGLLSQIRPKAMNKSLGDIIHFVCFGFVVLIIFGSVGQLVLITKNTLLGLQTQMEIGFPILLTLMTAIGATVSVGIYQPAVAVLSGVMLTFCVDILLPIFIFSIIFNVAGNISNNVKLTRFSTFFSNTFKWIIGLVFTVFSAFLTVQGISAGSYDGISIRATKYAIKSYVPILGSYLADGFSLILSSSILIKNAIGVSGLILLFATIIGPLLKIVIFQLGLNLVSAILEPISDNRTNGFLSGIAKSLNMLIAIILAFSFAYFIMISLIMCTSNAMV